MNPGPAISIFSKADLPACADKSLMEFTSSSAIFLGGFFNFLESDIAIGVAKSPIESSGGTSISIEGIVTTPSAFSESSIIFISSFFIKIKFKHRMYSKSTKQSYLIKRSFRQQFSVKKRRDCFIPNAFGIRNDGLRKLVLSLRAERSNFK